jgi:hypothetical protein
MLLEFDFITHVLESWEIYGWICDPATHEIDDLFGWGKVQKYISTFDEIRKGEKRQEKDSEAWQGVHLCTSTD